MVGVDDVGRRDRVTEADGERVRGVPADERERAKHADAEPARLLPAARSATEGYELGLDVRRESPGELERVALAAAEDPRRAKRRGSDLDDAHLVLPLVTLGDPRRLSGGYLYHLRMAEAAPAHGAVIRFLSFPERTFPLAAVHGASLLRRARSSASAKGFVR